MKFLITAGPTQEPLDPVRYLSNRSSGKMGYAIAAASRNLGHRVTLVSGPVALDAPDRVKVIPVTTAREMYDAILRLARKADVIIMVAAVADFRPATSARFKIKKTGRPFSLRFVPTPDILESLGRRKRKNQILVGFAAETSNAVANAKKKLLKKNCDWMILNRIDRRGSVFGSEENKVTLLSRSGLVIPLPRAPKKTLAAKILREILKERHLSQSDRQP